MNFSPAWSRHFRALSDSKAIFLLLLLVPAAAHAQGAAHPLTQALPQCRPCLPEQLQRSPASLLLFLAVISSHTANPARRRLSPALPQALE